MRRRKKTLYEVLEVQPDASSDAIKSAYQKACEQLKLKQQVLDAEEIALQQKVIDLAYDTLSVSTSRDAYDAKLTTKDTPAITDKAIKLNVAIEENKHSPLRRVLAVIAGVMVVWLSMQLIYMFMVYRANHGEIIPAADIANQAEEKVRMQEYYQEHGVRAGSMIEADLLDAEQRKKDAEQRAKEYEEKERERKYQEFLQESHRVGDQVSQDLMQAEEAARRQTERERELQEQEKRRNAELEQQRIQNERNKWKLN